MFADPHVGSVESTSGDHVVTGVQMIACRRLSPSERRRLEFAAGTNESVIVGAFARGPEAGEWIGQLTLAVLARTPIAIPLDTPLSPLQVLEERL